MSRVILSSGKLLLLPCDDLGGVLGCNRTDPTDLGDWGRSSRVRKDSTVTGEGFETGEVSFGERLR